MQGSNLPAFRLSGQNRRELRAVAAGQWPGRRIQQRVHVHERYVRSQEAKRLDGAAIGASTVDCLEDGLMTARDGLSAAEMLCSNRYKVRVRREWSPKLIAVPGVPGRLQAGDNRLDGASICQADRIGHRAPLSTLPPGSPPLRRDDREKPGRDLNRGAPPRLQRCRSSSSASSHRKRA